MDAEHAVAGIRVVCDVERPVTGRDDRCAVHGVGAFDADERAVARASDCTRLEVRERETSRPRLRDPCRAEVRCSLEVDDRLAELVLVGRGRLEPDRLHGLRVADREVAELRRVVHAEVVRDSLIGGVEQDIPDLLLLRGAFVGDTLVERQADRLLAQVDLERAFLGQVVSRQDALELPEALGRSGRLVVAGPPSLTVSPSTLGRVLPSLVMAPRGRCRRSAQEQQQRREECCQKGG